MIWNFNSKRKMKKLVQLAADTLMENSINGLLVVDTEYNVLYANQVVLEKYPSIMNLSSDEERTALVDLFSETETVYKKDDCYYEIRVSKLCEDGVLRGYMAWISDMSFLNEYTDEILNLKAKLESVTKEKETFIEDVTSEVCETLDSISEKSEQILIQSGNPAETQDVAFEIRSFVKDLRQRLDSLFAGQKSETGKSELVQEVYYVQSLLEEVSHAAKKQAKEKGLCYQVTVDEKLPYRLKGAVDKIQKMLATIFNLAMQDAVEGTFSLKMGSTWRTRRQILLEMIISEENVVREEENEELDFAIIRDRVKKLDGEIEIWQDEGVGTKMKLTLLQEIVDERPIGNIRLCLEEVDDTEFSQTFITTAKVLLLDSDEQSNELTIRELTKYGMKVDVAVDGEQALAFMQNQEYDFVFMDYLMPGIDCVEIMLRMRELENGKYQQLPIVAFSKVIADGVKEDILTLGFDEYLEKPLDLPKLAKMLLERLPKTKISYIDKAYFSKEDK